MLQSQNRGVCLDEGTKICTKREYTLSFRVLSLSYSLFLFQMDVHCLSSSRVEELTL